MSIGLLPGYKNIPSDLSLLDLPRDILGSIIEKCDEYTWVNLHGTCRICRVFTNEYMSEETAARRVFSHPDLYPSLGEGLRRSPHVATNAFSRQPSLLYDRATPLSISTNLQMVKVALITAELMDKSRLYRKICSAHQDPSVGRLTEEVGMALQKLDHVFIKDIDGELLPPTSEVWSIPSFMFRYFLPREGVKLALEASCVGYGGNSVIANKDVMKAIVKYCPEVMQYASEALRDCSDFALELVRVNPKVLPYMSDRVRFDRDLALRMIQDSEGVGGELLSLLPEHFRDDEVVVLTAIGCQRDKKESIMAGHVTHSILQCASHRLQSDRKVVLAAVRKYGSALCHAIGFKDDKEIVMTALRTRNDELQRIFNETCMEDHIFEIHKKYSGALLSHLYVSDTLRDDQDVVFLALSNTTENFQHASLSLKRNKVFCLGVLQYYKEAFEHFDIAMRRDPDIQRASEYSCCVIL